MALGLTAVRRQERQVTTDQETRIPAKLPCPPAAVTALVPARASYRQRLVGMAQAPKPVRRPARQHKTAEGLAPVHRIPL
jgi:hypothetical protein